MEKHCRNCKYCKNNPYGEWFCVDKKGKIIKELFNLDNSSCKRFKQNKELSEDIKMWLR